MAVTATYDPTSAPPTVHLVIAAPDASTITACVLYRTANGATELTRVQPFVGVAVVYFDDVEAAWDTDVSYTATVTTASGTTTMTSNTVTVSPGFPWAIHPTRTALSLCLDWGVTTRMGVAAIDAVTQQSKATRHDVIDSPYPVLTRVGPRAAVAGTLTISTVTAVEESSLRALLYDETPILIRVPSAWGWGWEDGFYAIDSLTDSRFQQYGPDARRTFTLPFQRVQPPAGDVQDGWGYPQLASDIADYATLTATFADYSALYADIRGTGTPADGSATTTFGSGTFGSGTFG